ncbi:hypothetical protein GQ44DRAFT_735705 [Phaeosphaeriaceae sp. PMI808]|nr:hypothetical protein GQ44DRAFT_735705 [Phaeosphaeriaceae sp. PMI808]
MYRHTTDWVILSSEITACIRYNALVPAIAFTSLAFVMVIMRWYSRIASKQGIGIDDYLVAVAMASFALKYIRLFSHIRSITYICYILLVLILGATAWGVFGVIFLCEPTRSYWNLAAVGKCMNAEGHFFSTSVVSIVLDWAIWMLPIPVVGRLRLPHRQKMGLQCVFGLGVFVCIVSVLRLALVHHFAFKGEISKAGAFTLMWSTIEINVAITCASLLVMKPFFARFIPAIVSEQPVSAREDARLWRGATGRGLLAASIADEEKQEGISLNRQEYGMAEGV